MFTRMLKDKEAKKDLISLPDKNDPDYFRKLVDSCILAYEELSNDGLALDYCMIADRKLRSMILNDGEYKSRTKNIYARQRLEEMKEVEFLARLAENGGVQEEDDEDYYAPRDGERKVKKVTGADKDVINMRFKAAQLKRELRAELAESRSAEEADKNIFLFSTASADEISETINTEVVGGADDVDMSELLDTKEAVPFSEKGSMRSKGMTKVDDESLFKVLDNGEIIEL